MIKDPANFGILTTETEKSSRISLCNSCKENVNILEVPTCNQCACPIDYVITYKFKICPLEKWSIE